MLRATAATVQRRGHLAQSYYEASTWHVLQNAPKETRAPSCAGRQIQTNHLNSGMENQAVKKQKCIREQFNSQYC